MLTLDETHPELFPVMLTDRKKGNVKVKWSAGARAYGVYAALYGSRQSLERLAERGGFHEEEMDTFYPEWRNHIVN